MSLAVFVEGLGGALAALAGIWREQNPPSREPKRQANLGIIVRPAV